MDRSLIEVIEMDLGLFDIENEVGFTGSGNLKTKWVYRSTPKNAVAGGPRRKNRFKCLFMGPF